MASWCISPSGVQNVPLGPGPVALRESPHYLRSIQVVYHCYTPPGHGIHMYVLLYTYVYICTKDRMNLFTTTWMHTVRVFKIDAAIRNAFPKCVCGATPLQTRRLLPKIGRLLPRIGKFFLKNRKASSEERWVRTHISFRNAVQLRLRIFRVRV